MNRIDPHASWLALEAHAAALTASGAAEEVVALVIAVRDHMQFEIQGELGPLMSTLTAEPIYHFWGNGDPMVLSGRQVIEGFYADMFGRLGNQFEVVIDRVVADTGAVLTEGQVKQVYTADALTAAGVTQVGDAPTASSELWLSCAQLVTVWPNDGAGKLVGEDIYFGQAPMTTLEPMSREGLPEYYRLPD